jgi:hypothetical protein
MAPSFDPQTELFYLNARRIFSVFYNTVTSKSGRMRRTRQNPVDEFDAACDRLPHGKNCLES